MKHLVWILLIFLPSFLIAQSKISAVSFNRTACFGRCPAYRLMVTEKGEVFYDGFSNAKFDGYYVGQVNSKKVKAIFAKYRTKPFLSLPNKYTNKISDISQLHMTLKINGKVKTIRHAHMGPAYVKQLAKDLDAFIAKEKITWAKGDPENMIDIESMEILSSEVKKPKEVVKEEAKKEIPKQEEVFMQVEQEPEFPGGDAEFNNYLSKTIVYPSEAESQNIQGRVICSFIINSEGHVEQIKVVKSAHPLLDKEAVRVLNAMPIWKPGRINGKPVSVIVNVPINFTLNN